jgi:hypothetical protein
VTGIERPLYKKTPLFVSFSYVCPERALVGRSLLVSNCAKKESFSYLVLREQHVPAVVLYRVAGC